MGYSPRGSQRVRQDLATKQEQPSKLRKHVERLGVETKAFEEKNSYT